MKRQIIGILGIVMAVMLAGCAGQPQQFVVQRPDEQKPQTVTFPNGTVEHRAVRRARWPSSWSSRTITT